MSWSWRKTAALLLLFVVGYCLLRRIARRAQPVRLVVVPAATAARRPAPPARYRIPLRIHQTHKQRDVPERMGRAIEAWVDLNPEFEHRYYDDADLEAYVREHGDERTNAAFDALLERFPKKGALRADLFRLVVMRREGGVYVDVDATPKKPLLDVLEPDDDYLTGVGRRNDAHQWLLIAVPNHPFIAKTLALAVDAILRDEPAPGGVGRHAGYAGPPMLDRGIRQVLAAHGRRKDMRPGTHAVDGAVTYRVVAGDFLGGAVRFKYDGYHDDLRELGLTHWTAA